MKGATSSARDLQKYGLAATVVRLLTEGAGNFAGYDVAKRKLVDGDHETRKTTPMVSSSPSTCCAAGCAR